MWLTLVPAVLAALAIGLALIGRLPAGPPAAADAGRLRRLWGQSRAALRDRRRRGRQLLRRHDPLLVVGIVGYWAWDNLTLWATFHAVGYAPARASSCWPTSSASSAGCCRSRAGSAASTAA